MKMLSLRFLAVAVALALTGGLVLLRGPTLHQYKVQWDVASCKRRAKSGDISFWVAKLDNDAVCEAYGKSVLGEPWEAGPVPEIIHQSWKNKDIPENFKRWSESWKKLNPTWEYRFWTDADNDKFVKKYYPEFLKSYEGMPYPINRADMIRGLYMHKYGGVYADLDTWCLRPMDRLVTDNTVYLAEMSTDVDFSHNIPNAWFASSPGHPFWIFFTTLIEELLFAKGPEEYIQPEQLTGPIILKQAVDAWNSIRGDDPTITIVKAGKVFVDDWHAYEGEEKRELFREKCKAKEIHTEKMTKSCREEYPDAYVLTYWTHTWGRRRRR
mmetsp:Transcript_7238/g.14486  ORF Transcript_7238/g.14486 Transcript_7238/m.14486 type:complete len:325 (-) Transcript_7238:1371-2345(-)